MIRYIGEELINPNAIATSKETYTGNKQSNSAAYTHELSERADGIRKGLQLSGKDRLLFHVSPLNDLMPDLFDVVLTSESELLIPERSARAEELASLIADNQINLVITSTQEWLPIYAALNKQQRVKRLKLVLIDDAGNLLERSAWILRSLSAEKGDDPYSAYHKARGIWK